MIRKIGPRRWQLRTRDGRRLLGTHPSRAAALRQEAAVKANERRRAKRRRRK